MQIKTLELKATNQTPYVLCDPEGFVKFEGRSFPTNSFEFFSPIIRWAENYKAEHLLIDVNLEYFNTSTCKQLLFIFRLFSDNLKGKDFKVNWHYEEDDADIKEIGMHYETVIPARFNFVVHKALTNNDFLVA